MWLCHNNIFVILTCQKLKDDNFIFQFFQGFVKSLHINFKISLHLNTSLILFSDKQSFEGTHSFPLLEHKNLVKIPKNHVFKSSYTYYTDHKNGHSLPESQNLGKSRPEIVGRGFPFN